MRVRRLAQVTLPAEMRRALNVQEGDYSEAEIVKDGVLLKPVAGVERDRAWQRIEEVRSRVLDLMPNPDQSATQEEDEIAEMVKEFRRAKNKHG